MDNQHKKISGYRDLTQAEIDAMNRNKELAQECGALLDKLEQMPETDKRSLDLARANLQQGFMWATRSIARPTTFG